MQRVDLPHGSDSPATSDFSGSVSGDRRATKRLPIELVVRYRVLGGKHGAAQQGSGTTLDMSSGGITTESALATGELVEVSVSWGLLVERPHAKRRNSAEGNLPGTFKAQRTLSAPPGRNLEAEPDHVPAPPPTRSPNPR